MDRTGQGRWTDAERISEWAGGVAHAYAEPVMSGFFQIIVEETASNGRFVLVETAGEMVNAWRRLFGGRPVKLRSVKPAGSIAMATAINFTIGATDQTSKAMEAVNKRIADFQARTQRSMSGVEKRMEAVQARFNAMASRMGAFAGGAVKVAGGFREIARAGTDAYQRLGQLVPVLGVITSAATVAGISRMETAWADWGQRIANTSQRIGIAARACPPSRVRQRWPGRPVTP